MTSSPVVHEMARPKRRVSMLRYTLTYAATLLLGVASLLVVTTLGHDTEAAPQAPQFGAVSGDLADCLGDRVATVQSGVFLDLHEARAGSDRPGQQLAGGRLDGPDASADLRGVCPDGTPQAGAAFELDLLVDEGEDSIVGTALVAGEQVPVAITAATVSGAEAEAAQLSEADLSGRILLAVTIVVVTARGAGLLFSRLRQPRVVGEIVAGIVLGPSVVGALFPAVTTYLFPDEVTSVLRALAEFGLVLFMFLIGLELDNRLMKGLGRAALIVSQLSIVVPFALGLGLALVLFPLLGTSNFLGFALFMGAAMAITAFPVLARILTDTGIHRTRLGALAITCAAVGDVIAWCILAVVVAVVNSTGPAAAIPTIALSLVFVLVMLYVVRPVLARLAAVHEARGRMRPPVLAAVLVMLLLSAWATTEIGIHAIFGAFLLGAVMPRSHRLTEEISGKLEDVTVVLLLPIFFAVVGLSTRFDGLDRPELWAIAGLVLAVAVVGKLGGSMVAARAAGQGWRHSAGLGILMNTRGLTEIVILSIGRELGIISPALFTIMVFMALVTTAMATPLLSIVYPRRVIDWELYRDSAAALQVRGDGVDRVVIALGGSDRDEGLLSVAAALRASDGHLPEIVLMQVVGPPGREEVRGRLAGLDEAVQAAVNRLEPVRARLSARGLRVRVRTAAAVDVGAEIAQIAREEDAGLVLLGWHRAYFGRNLFKGVPGDVLRIGTHDVALLVDDDDRSTPAQGPVAIWYNGSATGGAALKVAVSLARGLGTSLRVAHGTHVGPIDLADAGVSVEMMPPLEAFDPDLVRDWFSDARLVVTGDLQRSTLRSSARERLVRSLPCPVLVVRGAQRPPEDSTDESTGIDGSAHDSGTAEPSTDPIATAAARRAQAR